MRALWITLAALVIVAVVLGLGCGFKCRRGLGLRITELKSGIFYPQDRAPVLRVDRWLFVPYECPCGHVGSKKWDMTGAAREVTARAPEGRTQSTP